MSSFFQRQYVRSETSCWVGPLIAHGADATMGTVYEPRLGWTPHEDILQKGSSPVIIL